MSRLPPVIPRNQSSLVWLVAAAAGVAGVSVLYFFLDPAQHAFFPRCTFHQMTGLDCPGCGTQRALHQLLHGRWIEALRFNALLVLLLPVGLWWLGQHAIHLATGRLRPRSFQHPAWRWGLFAFVLGFSIWRNLPSIFSP